jgi:hypothetical protein
MILATKASNGLPLNWFIQQGWEMRHGRHGVWALTFFRQLWQLPLLVFSVFLFGYAAYLFIDPKPGPSVAQKIETAKTLLKQNRPQAAIEPLM